MPDKPIHALQSHEDEPTGNAVGLVLLGSATGLVAGVTCFLLGASLWMALGAHIACGSVSTIIFACLSLTKRPPRKKTDPFTEIAGGPGISPTLIWRSTR